MKCMVHASDPNQFTEVLGRWTAWRHRPQPQPEAGRHHHHHHVHHHQQNIFVQQNFTVHLHIHGDDDDDAGGSVVRQQQVLSIAAMMTDSAALRATAAASSRDVVQGTATAVALAAASARNAAVAAGRSAVEGFADAEHLDDIVGMRLDFAATEDLSAQMDWLAAHPRFGLKPAELYLQLHRCSQSWGLDQRMNAAVAGALDSMADLVQRRTLVDMNDGIAAAVYRQAIRGQGVPLGDDTLAVVAIVGVASRNQFTAKSAREH